MTGIAVGSAALIGVAFGWWGLIAAAASMIAVFAVVRGQIPTSAIALVLIVATVGAWRSTTGSSTPVAASVAASLEQATVVSAPVRDGRQQQFVVETAVVGEPAQVARICVTADAIPEVHLGDVVHLSGKVRAPIDVPVGARASLAAQSCSGSLYASWVAMTSSPSDLAPAIADLRDRISATLRGSAPGDAGVLLSGLVTGDDAAFSKEREEAFRRTGTTHLTAVSGSNLALIAGILASIGVATLGRHRIAWQAITIAGVWTYAVISGSQPPAIRAAIVAMAAILAFGFGRRPDFPTLILLAAGAMAMIDPAQIEHLGFRLSVAASLSLAVVLPPLIDHQRGFAAGGFLAAATAAQIATLPLLIPIFGTVSLVSVPANLLVMPLVAVAMPIAACAGILGLFSTPLAEVVAVPAALLATATLAIVDRLGTPGMSMQIGIPPLGAALSLAAAAAGLLLVVSGDVGRVLARRGAQTAEIADSTEDSSATRQPEIVREQNGLSPIVSRADSDDLGLSTAAARVLRGVNPASHPSEDAHDAEQYPAGEKQGH
jgi:competence protein ComEC